MIIKNLSTFFNICRKKLFERFYTRTAKKRSVEKVDLCVFLDSVGLLDESFQELETYLAYREAEPAANLILTIAMRSSQLKKLKLNFKFIDNWSRNKSDWEPLIQPLNSLQNLPSSTLYHLLTADDPNILSLIGKCCPSLSHLCLKKPSSLES